MPEYARTVHARGHCNSQSGMHSSAQTQPGATNRNAINNDINNDFDNMMLLRACKRKSGVAQISTLTETLSESCHLSELHTARYKYCIVRWFVWMKLDHSRCCAGAMPRWGFAAWIVGGAATVQKNGGDVTSTGNCGKWNADLLEESTFQCIADGSIHLSTTSTVRDTEDRHRQ